jgi:hypothetical protein
MQDGLRKAALIMLRRQAVFRLGTKAVASNENTGSPR